MENQYNNLNRKLDKLQKEKQTKEKKTDTHLLAQFYARTVNLTNIRFTQEEIMLLNNGLQHSIEKPLKKYWTNLIIKNRTSYKKAGQ